jgi:D-3-phosphoglycerate dehydrogenase
MKRLSLTKQKINILLLEGIDPKAETIFRKAGYENVTCAPGSLAGAELAAAVEAVHFIGIRSRTQLDARILRSAKRLSAIGCFCIGTNQVDLDVAHDCGVPVFNAPFSNTRSVAELVLAEMILLMRGVPERNAGAHRGEWAWRACRGDGDADPVSRH